MNSTVLAFEPLHSSVSPEFFHDVYHKKLHEFKLDNSPKRIFGTYQLGQSIYADALSSRFRLSSGAFADSASAAVALDSVSLLAPGTLHNANTLEEFKAIDMKSLLRDTALNAIWRQGIVSQQWLSQPSLLASFVLLTFADLKSHKYVYWFGFPALVPSSADVKLVMTSAVQRPLFATPQRLNEVIEQYLRSAPIEQRGFFLLCQNEQDELRALPLTQWHQAQQEKRVMLVFVDPSALAENCNWILRNYLLAASQTFGKTQFEVLALRQSSAGRADYAEHSLLFTAAFQTTSGAEFTVDESSLSVVGWEKNSQGKAAPRVTDLGQAMDPVKLAESSAQLNLSLMKWRMMPSLDLEKLAQTKCLLLGSGTLGCHVARNLVAWGMYNITFVDRTRVSYSNPVRQPLFTHEDCLHGGKLKSQAAAEHLKEIYPKVNVQYHQLDMPMPGHVVANEQETRRNVELLERLIDEHDAVFLLTDTRESRWLPTVLGAVKGKIVINAALGFDSFLVMRHGYSSQPADEKQHLGCYFCNDVVAPVDSTKDRTLDQQCTVTRPGTSATASAMAVELLVALLHHPQAAAAPSSEQSPLGSVPHQIRGSVSTFQNVILSGQAYGQCTACSPCVLRSYREQGFPFLKNVFDKPQMLEELTGLKELHEKTQKMLDEIELVEDDEEGDQDNVLL